MRSKDSVRTIRDVPSTPQMPEPPPAEVRIISGRFVLRSLAWTLGLVVFGVTMPLLGYILWAIMESDWYLQGGVVKLHARLLMGAKVGGLVVFGVGLVWLIHALILLRYKRIIENTPTSKMRSLAMGLVEVSGRARRYYDVRAPYSGTACVYYRCRVYHEGGHGRAWTLVQDIASGQLPFYVEDHTGTVRIEPRRAVFNISKPRQDFGSGRHPFHPGGQEGFSGRKVVEELIPEGATVYVLGAARTVKRGKTTREGMMERLRWLKRDPEQLSRYDRNHDGHIDTGEWDMAVADVEQQVLIESLHTSHTLTEEVVLSKPSYGRMPFLIADAEEGLTKSLDLRVKMFLAAGLAALGTGVWIFVRFHI